MATKTELVTVYVMAYDDAALLGSIEMPKDEWDRYAANADPAYQWPQGIARAGDVLSEEQLEELEINPETTIYLQ